MRTIFLRLLIVAPILCPIAARADGPEFSSTGASAQVTRLGALVSSQCVTFSKEDDPRAQHQTANAQLDLSAVIPDYDKSGFAMTGGGCEQNYGTIPSGMIPGYVFRNAPVGPSTWSCIIGDQPGWPNQSDGGPFYRAKVHATACRTAVAYDPVDAPSPFPLAGGLELAIARVGTAFAKPLVDDYRICNTSDAGEINAVWSDAKHQSPTDRSQSKLVSHGACIEFGGADPSQRATSIRLYNATAGQFARYPAGTFSDVARVDGFPIGVVANPQSHPVNAVASVTKPCTNVANPAKSQQPGDTIWPRQCQLNIPNWGHYRVCFDTQYVELVDGTLLGGWPATRMPMVLDKAMSEVPIGSNAEDARFNWIFPGGCRDYWDVTAAYVLVGRTLGDPNFDPGAIYDPNKVKAVHMWVSQIK